jgi:preprotein translocase subunit Sec63
LPQFEKDEKITYMIVSHAPVAHIKLGGKWSLRIDEGMLTADKTLDIDKLRDENVGDDGEDESDDDEDVSEDDEDVSDDDEESGHHEETGHEIDALKERWNTLMEGVRDGVIIKFLFTRAQG